MAGPKIPRVSWPVSYGWLAAGTLVAYSAVGVSKVALAQRGVGRAKELRPPATMSELPVTQFDIPPGPLGAVVAALKNATGLQILTVDQAFLSLYSPGVSGICTVEMALKEMLRGTGLSYRFTGPETIELQIAAVVSSIDVTAASSQLELSSPKYAVSLRDTPQTVSVIPKQVMDEQGATTLRDALRNVAGISLAAGEGGSQGDSLTIRGFAARNDLFIDGMRDFGSYYRDPFNVEEVQVVQGSTSVTFGRGATGGIVNQTSKAPADRRFVSGDLQLGSDFTQRATVDLNRPFAAFGRNAALRLNLMGEKGNVAGRDVAKNRRFGVAPSLALGLGTSTRWTLAYFHQTGNDVPDYGIPWLFNAPAPVNRQNYYGFENGNFLRTSADISTAKVEHDVNAGFAIRNQVRYATYGRDLRITEARVPSTLTPDVPHEGVMVDRNQIAASGEESYLADQLDFTLRFATGFAQHTLVAGTEAGRETSSPVRTSWDGVPQTSLLNPHPQDTFAGSASIRSAVYTKALSAGAYFLDTIRLGEKWEVTGGLRWDRFDVDYRQSFPVASAFRRVDEMPSWRAGVVYKPVAAGRVYAAVSTSFNPSAESLSLSAGTADLPPEENTTYEFGSNWDVDRGRLSLHTAVFRIDKRNARERDPNNALLNVLAGAHRVDGLEVELRGRLTSRWELLSSYAYLDGKVIRSQYYPESVGARLANVPRNTFSFWSTWRLPRSWQVGAGANFVDSRSASSTAPFDPVTGLRREAPGYWLCHAMLGRPLNDHVAVQANLYNLANRYYYDLLHPGHVVVGPGRSVLIGLKFKF